MLQQYAERVQTLSPDEVALVVSVLSSRRLIPRDSLDGGPGGVSAEALVPLLDRCSIQSADVVVLLLRQGTPVAQNAVEKLVGRPITILPPQASPPPAPKHEGAQPPPPDTSLMGRRTIHNIQPNPKREGTGAHVRYGLYYEGMTVAEYLAAGGAVRDVSWDSRQGYVEVRDGI